MASVHDVLRRKSVDRPAVLTIDRAASVREAVRMMVEHRIGGLPVLDGDTLVGIFTERDLLRRVVGPGGDVETTRVADVMSHPVVVAERTTPIDECAALMTARKLRHLPIVDGPRLVGMLTIGDVLATQVDERQGTIEELSRYVFDMR